MIFLRGYSASEHYRIVLNWRPDEPVYHAARIGWGFNPWKTVCGRVISVWQLGIPTKHARRIGRPCKDCFPDGTDIA